MNRRIERLQAIIRLCGQRPHSAAELAEQLQSSARTIANDIRWLKQQGPNQFVGHIDHDHTKRFVWRSAPIVVLREPMTWLSEVELTALVLGRGLLRNPRGQSIEAKTDAYPGLFARALHQLIQRSGLHERADEIAPEAIQVSRFAARDEDPQALETVMTAIACNESLKFSYVNRQGESHPVHAHPVRLVLMKGEFHCFAWAGHRTLDDDVSNRPIRQYRIARMSDVQRTVTPPTGCPAVVPQRLIDRELEHAFETTGSGDPKDRVTVQLAVSPDAYPHLEGRTFGSDQKWISHPRDLPDSWRRLRFTTSGLEACRHWVLSLGSTVRAEKPKALVRWIREEAQRMLEVDSG